MDPFIRPVLLSTLVLPSRVLGEDNEVPFPRLVSHVSKQHTYIRRQHAANMLTVQIYTGRSFGHKFANKWHYPLKRQHIRTLSNIKYFAKNESSNYSWSQVHHSPIKETMKAILSLFATHLNDNLSWPIHCTLPVSAVMKKKNGVSWRSYFVCIHLSTLKFIFIQSYMHHLVQPL